MPLEPKQRVRKPRLEHKPYKRPSQPQEVTLPGKTSAIPPAKHARSNLTLRDWLDVVAYYDNNQPISQADIVKHFATRKEGALIFNQSSLSRHLSKKGRDEDKTRLESNPTALSAKRVRVVTRPDVEEALFKWVKHMGEKGEHVTGAMLVSKREKFEDALGVPEEEKLQSHGWITNFCRTYNLKEFRRHGEAGSVDTEAVAKERERIQKIYAEYLPEDQLNFDESGLFGCAPPDRGLAMKQMPGKKSNKTRITVGFMCNATGTEKWPIFFIGKSKRPRCFWNKTPEQHGFNWYRNNKTAWMTAELFEQWIKYYDRVFRDQNRKVCLWLDNFAGHAISYKPTNIRLESFAPNMTSFVQPLDAGIIRCFKAHYRRAFCQRAVELDEAGEDNIYDINLLEVMTLAKEAWANVSSETIKNCWNHAFQLSNSASELPSTVVASDDLDNGEHNLNALVDPAAWEIVTAFANGMATLPETEEKLSAHLGDHFSFPQWKAVFDEIFKCEDDVDAATTAIETLKKSYLTSGLPKPPPTQPATQPSLPELDQAENELMQTVENLYGRKRLRGTRPTLEDLLNPAAEREVGFSPFRYPGGDAEIIAEVKRNMENTLEGPPSDSEQPAVDGGDDNDDSDSKPEPQVPPQQALALCAQLNALCLQYADADHLDLSVMQRQLRYLSAHLRKESFKMCTQVTLDRYIISSNSTQPH